MGGTSPVVGVVTEHFIEYIDDKYRNVLVGNMYLSISPARRH